MLSGERSHHSLFILNKHWRTRGASLYSVKTTARLPDTKFWQYFIKILVPTFRSNLTDQSSLKSLL